MLQPQGTFGNSSGGAFRGPDLRTVDLSAAMRIPLRGEARLDIRLEVFNVFNRANFGKSNAAPFNVDSLSCIALCFRSSVVGS